MDFLIHRSSDFSVCGLLFNSLLLEHALMIIIVLTQKEIKVIYKWLDNKPKADMQSAKLLSYVLYIKHQLIM